MTDLLPHRHRCTAFSPLTTVVPLCPFKHLSVVIVARVTRCVADTRHDTVA